MKRFLVSLLASITLLIGLPLGAQVSIDASKTGTSPYAGSYTWATKPTSAANGTQIFLTNVGDGGNWYQYSTGLSKWRAVNGAATIATLGNATGNISTSETIILQGLIPAGAWQTNDILRIWLTTSKSGTTDNCNFTIRVGTAGTTADTAITGASAFSLMGTTALSGGSVHDIKLLAGTSALRLGATSSGNGTYSSATNTGTPASATTITDASANALYVSIAIYSGGATNTCAAQSGAIQLITP